MKSLKIGQLKVFLRIFVVCSQLSILTACFWFCWNHFYEPILSHPYGNSGEIALISTYFGGLLFAIWTYGGTKYAYYQAVMLFLSQILAVVVTNVVVFFIFIFSLHKLPPILPIFVLTLVDIFLLLITTKAVLPFFRKIFPPKDLLLVCRQEFLDEELKKIESRKDLFRVKKVLSDSVSFDEIFETYKNENCNAIMINDLAGDLHERVIKNCYDKGIRLYSVPKIYEILLQKADRIHAFDTPVMLMRNEGFSYDKRIVKRLTDLAICVPALIVASPVMLLAAIAIKLEDGGDIFFKQERVTIRGKHFNVLKFRSMRMDAEKDGAKPCVPGDSRITRVGNFIRKTRIDELPQILNVLNGDMSIVGPRPERYEHVEKYTEEMPEFSYRLSVKAGITGYAQIYGKYNTTPLDKLKLDLMYIRNQSFMIDLKIIILTMRTMLTPSATEGFSVERSREINAATGTEK